MTAYCGLLPKVISSLTFLNTDTSGNIAAWDVNVSGRTGVYKARADRQGVLRIYRRAHSIIVR